LKMELKNFLHIMECIKYKYKISNTNIQQQKAV